MNPKNKRLKHFALEDVEKKEEAVETVEQKPVESIEQPTTDSRFKWPWT